MRVPRGSDQINRERLDTATTQMSPLALEEILAAQPRTSPAVIAREMRHDTVTDPGPPPTTALDPGTVAELAAARTAQELEVAPATVEMPPLAHPEGRRARRDRAIARPALPGGPSVRIPFVIAGMLAFAFAFAAIALLR